MLQKSKFWPHRILVHVIVISHVDAQILGGQIFIIENGSDRLWGKGILRTSYQYKLNITIPKTNSFLKVK